jgi:hypothetical protein
MRIHGDVKIDIVEVKNPFDYVDHDVIMVFFYNLVETRIRNGMKKKVHHRKEFSDKFVEFLKQKVVGKHIVNEFN